MSIRSLLCLHDLCDSEAYLHPSPLGGSAAPLEIVNRASLHQGRRPRSGAEILPGSLRLAKAARSGTVTAGACR